MSGAPRSGAGRMARTSVLAERQNLGARRDSLPPRKLRKGAPPRAAGWEATCRIPRISPRCGDTDTSGGSERLRALSGAPRSGAGRMARTSVLAERQNLGARRDSLPPRKLRKGAPPRAAGWEATCRIPRISPRCGDTDTSGGSEKIGRPVMPA